MQGGIKVDEAIPQQHLEEKNEQKLTFSMNVENGDSFVEKFLRVKEYEEILMEKNYSYLMEKKGDDLVFDCVHN